MLSIGFKNGPQDTTTNTAIAIDGNADTHKCAPLNVMLDIFDGPMCHERATKRMGRNGHDPNYQA